ncbi:MAG: glycosyltransferase [Flammeovirgaceae bacterium]|nr:MAG: glycosyltransferase [Flammeovirgaceae bacterium]
MICAHDEEKNLRNLIPALLQQDYPVFEVVVVDDRSNDGTYDYLRELSASDNRLRIVKVDHLPAHVNAKKYGITLGIKAASHEWILLTDADCTPYTTTWIVSMSRYMDENARFVLGYSPYEKQPGLLNLFIRYETLFTAIQYIGFAGLGMPYMGVGRNLAYRKSYFLANKGFNSIMNITGGDDDLYVNRHATAAITRVCTDVNAIVYSQPKKTVHDFLAQKKRHLYAGKKYRLKHKFLLGLFMGTQIFVWLTAFVLLGFGIQPVTVAALLLVRLFMLGLLTHRAGLRFGDPFPGYAVAILDILFAFYYLSTAPVALISKRVKWKN